jgi:hypothetical protein
LAKASEKSKTRSSLVVFCVDNVSFSESYHPINRRKDEGERKDKNRRSPFREYFCKEIMGGKDQNGNNEYEYDKSFHNKRLQMQPPLVSFLVKEDSFGCDRSKHLLPF